MNLIDNVWRKNENTNMVRVIVNFRAAVNSPCAPYTVSVTGFFMLYVLLRTAARPAQRRIEVVAIRLEPIIMFLRVWTARMFFLSMS